jgi:hypothetical protein
VGIVLAMFRSGLSTVRERAWGKLPAPLPR